MNNRNSNFGGENEKICELIIIKISAINVYSWPSRSLRAHHVVPSTISSAKVYVIRVKPVLTGRVVGTREPVKPVFCQ